MTRPDYQTITPRLEVLICTLGRALFDRTGTLPTAPGVRYIISCQDPEHAVTPEDIASVNNRADVIVDVTHSRGLSLNRNHALSLATAQVVMIADDDLIYHPDGLIAIADYMEANPDVDIMLTHSEMHDSQRPYPPGISVFPSPESPRWHPMSIELVLRVKSIKRMGLHFPTLAGLGSPRLECGEEELFMLGASRHGAVCRYVPITAATHPGETTSSRLSRRAGVLRAKGVVITALRGPLTALTRFPVEAWRSPAWWPRAFWHYMEGMVYYYRNRKELIP